MANGGASGFLKGAGGGALAGGSVGGPLGALIGGGLGGLAGLFGGGPSREQQLFQEYYDRTKGPAAQAGLSDFRGNQRALIERLEAMSRGEGPSLAAQQLRQATDRAVGQQAGMAQSGRGNPAMAQFQAQNVAGRLQAQAAQDAAAARIVEQQQANQLLGLNLHGAREQDEGMGRFNASQQNQWAQSGLGALQGMSGARQNSLPDQLLAGGAGMFAQGAMSRFGGGGGGGVPSWAMQGNDWYQGAPSGSVRQGQWSPQELQEYRGY